MPLNNKSKPCGILIGQKFGKLIVLKEEVVFKSGKNRIFATCECECGGKKICDRTSLLNGRTISCGCVRRETTIAFNKTKTKPPEERKENDRRYKMFHNAQHRAKKKGIPFSITIDDIIIPETCPLLGIPLISTNDKSDPRNPSLDQKVPGKGYTPDNIWVISSRANVLKWDASLQELELLVENLKCYSSSSSSNFLES
jgi:hypothetical protein